MDLKIEVVKRNDVADNERQDVTIETHMKRGDVYNVAKVDTVREGDSVVFRVPGGGRLMIGVPEGENEIVYDAAQGAAIRRSAQQNEAGKADSAVTGEQREASELGRRHDPRGVNPATSTQPGQPAVDPNRPSMRVQAGNQPRQPTPEELRAKAEAERKAKEASEAQARQRQQAGSGTGGPTSGTVSTDNLKDQK